MSGAQSSHGAALLRQFFRFATGSAASASSAGTHAAGSNGFLWRAFPCHASTPSTVSSGTSALLREAYMLRQSASTSLQAQTAAAFKVGAAHAMRASRTASGEAAVAALQRQAGRGAGMLQAMGVQSRSVATAAAVAMGGAGASATASASASASAGSFVVRGCAGLLAGLRRERAVVLLLRTKSTAAGTALEASAVAAAAAVKSGGVRRLYGGAALSEGLSRGARLALAGWLGVCSVWVYSMVVLGGITRLTRSGLSMTEWKLAGERPPMTEQEWVAEFAKYQASPEYLKVHRGMSLEEFKFIYWMEYAHRMWGRILGVAFAVPAAFFLARRWVTGALGRRLGLLFFMGGTQGLVGWWMVRSGLEEPEHEWAAPRVSPYRLAAHLVSAFAIYTTLVWTTLDLLYPTPATAGAAESLIRSTASARRRLLPLAALIAVTATSGAFVAGMDAGRAYNTWPLMAGRLMPEEYWDERLGLSTLRNLFENTAAVQFNHRTLATATLAAVGAAWLRYRTSGVLPARGTACLTAVAAVTALQFALGVYTLLEYVPVHLGSAHQANALNLFTAALALLHACRPPAPTGLAAAAAPLVTPAAVVVVGCIGYVVVTQNGTLTQSDSYNGPSNVTPGHK